MSEILQKIRNRTATAVVIGLGYVGLSVAVEAARASYLVYGIDIDQDKVDQLQSGKSYVSDIKDEDIQTLIHQRLHAVNEFSSIAEADVVIICLPTPLNKTREPDVSMISSAVASIIQYVTKDTLIILESTTYPGTTEELIQKVIEDEMGWKAGKDFFVCYSPERIDPGNRKFNVKNTPKIIGGISPVCAELGAQFYGSFLQEVIPVSSTAAAEMVKLLENTFRSVNIALVNELTLMCDRMGINIWEIIDAASSKPFGYIPFFPGPGIGGHCIPIDPIYLSWRAKMFGFHNKFIELADDINSNMPRYVVSQITDILNEYEKPLKNSNILCIGMAYKKDVNDLRESPALEVFKLLQQKEANVTYYDPHIPHFKNDGQMVYSVELTSEAIAEADLVVIITDHSSIDYPLIVENAALLYDTRNVTKPLEGNIMLLGGHKRYGNTFLRDEIFQTDMEGRDSFD
ncbi:UDP-N-acetyl-D-glucosamine dehydrogenase [Paenibacillus uliginis N3/975]|uniref:UDP-N-acetyl-D-glucosamine dehydrogenase n=1 Tax=Paenibacillus uliginis N3/975 TaxID=1313296 RepID=A0A1X7HML2_9BACL|nr:UDP-N-acetyl-D-glucosamine dehydrogenase [Paenibacillus uliginis N3/975]